jgi:hypothetical protein
VPRPLTNRSMVGDHATLELQLLEDQHVPMLLWR